MAERFETQSTKLSSANSVTDVYALANTNSSDDRSVVLSVMAANTDGTNSCLLYTSPSPRDKRQSRMPSSA